MNNMTTATQKLTFNNSFIYPDNSEIVWEMNGLGYVNGFLRFRLITNRTSLGYSHIVNVLDRYDTNESIEMSQIFWNVTEWDNMFKTNHAYAMKHEHYHSRQSAMQWCEDYLDKL